MTISCNKEDDASGNITSNDVVANQQMDAAIDDVAIIADDQYEDTEGTPSGRGIQDYYTILPACAEAVSVVTGDVRVTTVTFGTATTACLFRGRFLKGQIIFTHTITTSFPKTMTVTYNNFYINGNKLEGSCTWRRDMIGSGISLHPKITFTMNNMTLTTAEGVYTRNGERITEMTAGFSTRTSPTDDVYSTHGSFTTTHPNGNVFTTTVSSETPIVNKKACSLDTVPSPYPVSGILVITKNSHTASIDYGDGDCDNLAMLSIDGGVAFQITLGD